MDLERTVQRAVGAGRRRARTDEEADDDADTRHGCVYEQFEAWTARYFVSPCDGTCWEWLERAECVQRDLGVCVCRHPRIKLSEVRGGGVAATLTSYCRKWVEALRALGFVYDRVGQTSVHPTLTADEAVRGLAREAGVLDEHIVYDGPGLAKRARQEVSAGRAQSKLTAESMPEVLWAYETYDQVFCTVCDEAKERCGCERRVEAAESSEESPSDGLNAEGARAEAGEGGAAGEAGEAGEGDEGDEGDEAAAA